MAGWFDRVLIESGRLPLFLGLLAFVVTFLVTHIITRLIRSGRGPFKDNVSESGLHVHHAVPGVLILVTGAFVAVGASGATGWAELGGVLVGIGTALGLDEFALILRLDDVYWSEEGRVSVELIVLTVACIGLFLLGFNPLAFDGSAGAAAIASALVGIAVHLLTVLVTILKGKYRLALVAVFIPFVSLAGAIRLARPGSWWAKRRYDAAKLERATRRASKHDARYGPILRSLTDFVAGKPTGEIAS